MQSGGKDGKKPAKSGGRDERLKAALRENLKRRKEQARARGDKEPTRLPPQSPREDGNPSGGLG